MMNSRSLPALQDAPRKELSLPPDCPPSHSEPGGGIWAAPRSAGCRDPSRTAAANRGRAETGCQSKKNIIRVLLGFCVCWAGMTGTQRTRSQTVACTSGTVETRFFCDFWPGFGSRSLLSIIMSNLICRGLRLPKLGRLGTPTPPSPLPPVGINERNLCSTRRVPCSLKAETLLN